MEQVILDHLGKTSSLFGLFHNFVFDSNVLVSNKSKYEHINDFYQTKINGKFEGAWASWYLNGQMKRKGKYRKNRKEGKWTSWYYSGNIRNKGEYRNDKKVGMWKFWHENGVKIEEGKCRNGKREGIWTFWYENGTKVAEEYRNGKMKILVS